jgi:imidazoleglycerol-phosphate dehydratase
MADRIAEISRETKETKIRLALNLDGTGDYTISTGVGFFDHMLTHIGRHGLLDLTVEATGDLEVDAHHVVEDVGIVFGQALTAAVGDKRGIVRYGTGMAPMDSSLVMVVLDISGRPALVWDVDLPIGKVGEFDTELAREFFQAVANSAAITVHFHLFSGGNAHHVLESAFKSFGRALDAATALDPRIAGQVPSTKGAL